MVGSQARKTGGRPAFIVARQRGARLNYLECLLLNQSRLRAWSIRYPKRISQDDAKRLTESLAGTTSLNG